MTAAQSASSGPMPVKVLPDGHVAPVTPRKMRKVAFASFMGSVIEFYDFNIYATAAALVFATAYFPAFGTSSATVVSFATLGIAFIARPLGAIIFGHYGDRIGRKKTLIATMALMGGATFLIGLLPTAATIGVWAPIILVLLRIAQGISAGGEWAGAALFTSESAPKATRGFWAMFTNLGGAAANIFANATFLAAALFMTDDSFLSWGWRIPFLIAILLVALGLYIRLKLDETPVFKNQATTAGVAKFPLGDAFRSQWKQILLGMGPLLMPFAFGYVAVAYLLNYGTTALGFTRPTVLAIGILGAFTQCVGVVAAGLLADRFGRRRVLIGANLVAVPWAIAVFPLMDTKTVGAYLLGVCGTFLLAGLAIGIAGSLLSELFATRYRQTAAGITYSTSSIVGGALPPLIAAAVIPTYGGLAFGFILGGYCLISLVASLVIKETKNVNLDEVV